MSGQTWQKIETEKNVLFLRNKKNDVVFVVLAV